jgi:DNA-binding response OmpR family regulator
MTAVIMMGEKQIFSWLLDAFREGADDFLLKPFDPIEVRERIEKSLHRRQQRLESEKVRPPLPPPVPPTAVLRRDKSVDDLLRAVLEFQEQSLEVFLDLERKNLDLERELAALRDPAGGAKFNRDVRILIAHPDAALSQGLEEAVSTFGARLEPQAFSGGEVLDRIGNAEVDIVLVGSELPDIPGSIVSATVKSQLDGAEVLMLETIGSGELQLTALGDEAPPHAIASQQDLVNILKDRARMFRDRQEARQFARDFKGRHQDYIRSLVTLKSRVEKALGEG